MVISKKNQAFAEIFMASVFWGFGFIATVWAMKDLTASLALSYRFFLATSLSIIFLYFRKTKLDWSVVKQEAQYASVAGLLMGAMLLFQAFGLESTSATKNSFITSFYIFFVPILSFIFLKKKIFYYHLALIFLALMGCYFLFDMKLSGIQKGDLWTFLCSILAAVHLLYIGYVSKKTKDAFLFNTLQGVFAFIAVSLSLFTETQKIIFSKSILVWVGVFFLALFSSVIAFYLHIKSQKIISETTISMMCLLEAPIAAFFAFIFLSEQLLPIQIFGMGCILSASLIQCYLESESDQ